MPKKDRLKQGNAGSPGKNGKIYEGVDEDGRIIRRSYDGKVERLSSSPAQIRARARRAGRIHSQELAALHKPVEEWDLEELARGYPRSKDGHFRGGGPKGWVRQEVHEEAARRFQAVVKSRMGEQVIPALSVLLEALESTERDKRGRPVVPWSVKVDVAKFLVEQVVGKPKQTMEADLSVRLQGVLAHALVTPGEDGALLMAQGFAQAISGAGELGPGGAGDDEEDEE